MVPASVDAVCCCTIGGCGRVPLTSTICPSCCELITSYISQYACDGCKASSTPHHGCPEDAHQCQTGIEIVASKRQTGITFCDMQLLPQVKGISMWHCCCLAYQKAHPAPADSNVHVLWLDQAASAATIASRHLHAQHLIRMQVRFNNTKRAFTAPGKMYSTGCC